MKNLVNTTEINNLLLANYERMMAYENAYHHTTNAGLKEFLATKADESEQVVEQLKQFIIFNEQEAAQQSIIPAAQIIQHSAGKKSINFMINTIKTIEKSVEKMYKYVTKTSHNLPKTVYNLLKENEAKFASNYNTLAHI